MGSRLSSPGPQQRRFAAYIEGLANAAGHADRHTPLKNYCKGLLLPGERKSVEPMAARLAPNDCRRMHQSLHHLVADAPWNDEEMLVEVRRYVLPTMEKQGPVVAWIVDDTGFPKQGKHSVGVARQYCGQLGKSDNCQAAVSYYCVKKEHFDVELFSWDHASLRQAPNRGASRHISRAWLTPRGTPTGTRR